MPKLLQDEAVEGPVLARGQGEAEALVDLPQLRASRRRDHVLRHAGQRLLVHVGFVHDLADQLLQHVLQGDQPVGAAELVGHDPHVDPLRPEKGQQLRQRQGAGHEHRLSGQIGQGDAPPPCHVGLIRLPHVEYARDVVHALSVDGDPRVRHGRQLGHDLVQQPRVLPREDVHAGRHGVPGVQLVQLERPLHQSPLVRLYDSLVGADLQRLPDLKLLGRSAVVLRLRGPQPLHDLQGQHDPPEEARSAPKERRRDEGQVHRPSAREPPGDQLSRQQHDQPQHRGRPRSRRPPARHGRAHAGAHRAQEAPRAEDCERRGGQLVHPKRRERLGAGEAFVGEQSSPGLADPEDGGERGGERAGESQQRQGRDRQPGRQPHDATFPRLGGWSSCGRASRSTSGSR